MGFICALDSGSTGIRAILFDKQGSAISQAYVELKPIFPQEGWIEHDPVILCEKSESVIKMVIQNAKISPKDIEAIGVVNQRSSFLLFEKKTGKPLTNLINWADIRSLSIAEKMNKSPMMKIMKKMSGFAYLFTKNQFMLQVSTIKFSPEFCLVRLLWLFKQNPELLKRANKGEVLFGTIDTWLVYNLTRGKLHVTDYSNASATSLYDSFKLKWSSFPIKLFKIPRQILPEVRDTCGDFGETDPEIFGASIPIRAVAGDQMSALFGQCCFSKGDIKISHGSGSFVDINVGEKPIVSRKGLYPLIAWKIKDETKYMLEAINALTGTIINWAIDNLKLAPNPQELDKLAESVSDSKNLYFIPALNGLRFPYYNPYARGTFVGLTLEHTNAHLCRAILEGIAYTIKDFLTPIEEELKIIITSLNCDGGVSKSDFLLQFSADIINKEFIRAGQKESTALGAAFLAGLAIGFWKDINEIKCLKKIDKTFIPQMDPAFKKAKYKLWQNAIKRSYDWAK